MKPACDALAGALASHPAAKLFPDWAQDSIRSHGQLFSAPPGKDVFSNGLVLLVNGGAIGAVNDHGACIGLHGRGSIVGLEEAFLRPRELPVLQVLIHASWIAAPAAIFRSPKRPYWAERMYAYQAIDRQVWLASELACVQRHSAAGRLARWLVHLNDLNVSTDRLYLTQQALAQLLMIQRTTVNTTLKHLAASGALRIRRGGISHVDRCKLADAACPCLSGEPERF